MFGSFIVCLIHICAYDTDYVGPMNSLGEFLGPAWTVQKIIIIIIFLVG